jgi:tetratricopeptide (TPR) repeat protein
VPAHGQKRKSLDHPPKYPPNRSISAPIRLGIPQSKLYKLDLSADQHFDRYLNNYRGELYIKDAYQKLAWVHILKGNKGQADFCFQNALQKGTTYLAVDALAQAELELNIPTDPVLLRARLLYEGGYYAQAYKELAAKNESQFKSISHKVEFHYRMGLLSELVQKTDDAAKSYDLAASLGGNENHYYACAAALNAGKIWEKRQDSEKAKRYFQLCLKLKPKLYRTALHQEAQTRLQKYGKPR